MSNDYRYIRLSESLVVPYGTVFEPQEDAIAVWVPGFKEHWELRGAPAEACRAFLNGTLSFPVNDNAVLDIVAGWQHKMNASSLGEVTQDPQGAAVLAIPAAYGDPPPELDMTFLPPSGPRTSRPTLDMSRVKKRLQL